MPTELSDLAMYQSIVAAVLPLVIAIVLQPKWSQALRSLTAFGICVLVSVGETYWAGQLVLATWQHTVLLIFWTALICYTTYKRLWEPLGVEQKIEAASSILIGNMPD